MAVAFVRAHTAATAIKAAGTTIGLNISTIVPVGNALIAHIVFDNAATASKPIVSSIAKAAGETNNWALLGAARSTSTSAGAFASGEMWVIQTTVAWPVASYTVTLDTSTVMKATQAQEFSGLLATQRSTAGTAYSTTTTAASATTTGTTPVIGDLAIGLMFQSNAAAFATTDTDTVGGAWTGAVGVGSTGAGATTNNFGQAQYKILTAASHQTLNAAAALAAGNGSIVAILQAAPDAAVTQSNCRFYQEGSQEGSTALALENTAITVSVADANYPLQLRMRLQSTSAVTVPATEDWQLQFNRNSGGWVDVPPASGLYVNGYNSAQTTDGAALINQRITSGTGTFYPGKVAETGLLSDFGWPGTGHAEVLYSIVLMQTLSNADVIQFRLRTTTGTVLTFDQTPTVNVSKVYPAITQAAYRFYGEGTETGSTAAAAENTAYTVDVSDGPIAMQLRLQLQSTSAVAVPSTADWQLQYDLNTSGSWIDVAVPGLVMVDENPSVGYDAVSSLGNTGSTSRIGQSFLGDGRRLASAEVYMSRVGAPVGTVVAKLYAHTGAFGTGGLATGTALATSTNTIDSATLPTTIGFRTFTFDGSFLLAAGTVYVIAFEALALGASGNGVYIGVDSSSPSHIGNMTWYLSAWSADLARDIIFRVWTSPFVPSLAVGSYDSASLTGAGATTQRLSAGTGSFVAGEVTEDGVANDLGWTGNNYTELLYSIQMQDDKLLHNDVLRFRVLMNGAVTNLTYTQTPSLTIYKVPVVIPLTGLQLWLDASDISTFTLSGATVTQWRDKSAAAHHFSGGSVTRDGVINTLTSVVVSGYAASISCLPPITTVVDNFTMFCVSRRTGGNATDSPMFLNGNAASNGYALATRANTANTGILRAGIVWHASATADDGGTHLHMMGRASGVWGHRVDGAATSLDGTSFGAPNAPVTGTYIPSNHPAHDWAGDICEVVAYSSVLTVTQRQKVENYLIAKWITPPATGGRPKVWSGTAWAKKPLKVWSGSAWVEKPVKVWTGSAWKTLT